MSSFICSPRTINRITTYLSEAEASGSIHNSGIQFLLKKNRISLIETKKCEEFANCLLALNKIGTDTRYKENGLVQKMRFEWEHCDDFQALKSLRCLLYQCNEENVPKMKLFKVLDRLADAIAYKIIGQTKEYEAAEWD